MEILKHLKSAVREFWDSNNRLTLEVGKTGRKLDAKRHYIISSLFDLLFNTGYINEETKMCLLDYHLRLCDIQDELYRTKGIKLAYSTCINKVYRSLRKIEKNIGKDVIVDVVDFTTKDIDVYYNRINSELAKVKKNTILDIYDLDISNIVPSCSEVSLERLDKTCSVLRPYLKESKDRLLSSLDVEALAYIKYLYSLDRESDDRKEMIEHLIRGDN